MFCHYLLLVYRNTVSFLYVALVCSDLVEFTYYSMTIDYFGLSTYIIMSYVNNGSFISSSLIIILLISFLIFVPFTSLFCLLAY